MARSATAMLVLATALLCSSAFAIPLNATSDNGRKLLGVASPGGACGGSSGNTCPTGQCCSKWGWCGVTSGHCGSGCQAQYSAGGRCSTSTGGGTPTSSGSCRGTSSPGGSCGSAAGGKCCPSGQCCSQYGWCGVTSGHCGSGCQSTYSAGGKCSATPTPTPTPTPTNTGGGQTFTGRCSYHKYGSSPMSVACQNAYGKSPGKYITALNANYFSGYNSECGKCLRVKNLEGSGEIYVTVVDKGGAGGLDLNEPAAMEFQNMYARGTVACSWQPVDASMCSFRL